MLLRVLIALGVGFGLGLAVGWTTLPTKEGRLVEAYVAAKCLEPTRSLANLTDADGRLLPIKEGETIPLSVLFAEEECPNKARLWAWTRILNRRP